MLRLIQFLFERAYDLTGFQDPVIAVYVVALAFALLMVWISRRRRVRDVIPDTHYLVVAHLYPVVVFLIVAAFLSPFGMRTRLDHAHTVNEWGLR